MLLDIARRSLPCAAIGLENGLEPLSLKTTALQAYTIHTAYFGWIVPVLPFTSGPAWASLPAMATLRGIWLGLAAVTAGLLAAAAAALMLTLWSASRLVARALAPANQVLQALDRLSAGDLAVRQELRLDVAGDRASSRPGSCNPRRAP